MADIKHFFTEEEKATILDAIKQAELNTSGEIRLHVESVCKTDVLDRAADMFAMLKMHKTALRNGVLFYVAIESKVFAIIGDAGINAVVSTGFWDETKEMMVAEFKEGNFAKGITSGILKAGEQLKQHFSYQLDDVNELPDDISFGK